MSSDLELRLRDALETMSEALAPPDDLARRVRVAAARRRHTGFAALAAITLAVAVTAALALTSWQRSPAERIGPDRGPVQVNIALTGGYDNVAIGPGMLYVATGDAPDAMLSAYDTVTGQLIRQIHVPALPNALTVGPGGMVWLTFYPDQNQGGTGLWLLTADLSKRSSAPDRIAYEIGLAALLPTSPMTALVNGPDGLDELRMPAPGRSGGASLRHVAAVPTGHGFGGGEGIAVLGSHVAELQGRDTGGSRIVLAGSAGPAYEPHGVDIAAMTAEGGGLWVATGPRTTLNAPYGGLVRLGPELQVQTPALIARDPDLRSITGLVSYGDTVWVSNGWMFTPLCFRYAPGSGLGPVTFMPNRPSGDPVAATASTVYVANASGITSFPVPAACR